MGALRHSAEAASAAFAVSKDTEWMPDWSGETCVIVASGPSAKSVPLHLGKDRARFIVINDSWRLAPWADVLYACDQKWFHANRGMFNWPRLKVSQDRIAVDRYPDIKRVYAIRGVEKLTFKKPGLICWAGNSGTQALNLAAQWNPKKIILVGFDMTLRHGVHWHGKHPDGLVNPTDGTIDRWRRRTDEAYSQLVDRGIVAINCSDISALKNYPVMSFEAALDF